MKQIILERHKIIRSPKGSLGTPGRWIDSDGRQLCKTLERPELFQGKANVSDDPKTSINESCCFPEGIYKVKWTFSNRFKKFTFEILDVLNRGGIRIHSANVITELLGCISPCLEIKENHKHTDGKIYALYASQSKTALQILEKRLPKNFELQILSEEKMCSA